jgi:hypothetical protein
MIIARSHEVLALFSGFSLTSLKLRKLNKGQLVFDFTGHGFKQTGSLNITLSSSRNGNSVVS